MGGCGGGGGGERAWEEERALPSFCLLLVFSILFIVTFNLKFRVKKAPAHDYYPDAGRLRAQARRSLTSIWQTHRRGVYPELEGSSERRKIRGGGSP